MPGFAGVLDEMEIAGLARYVLGLRDVDEWPFEAMETIGIGTRPPLTADLVTHGASLYIEMGCVSCHGETGRGDGENANGLFDFENNPVRPADFTSGLFKSGQTPEALCRTIIAGIPGTPMVAYEAALMQENDDGTVNTIDAWSLVAFIRTLAPTTPPPGIPSGARVVPSMAADEAMLTDPTHPAWLGVDPIYIRLKPLQQRPGQAAFMEIRAVRTDDAFALCLDWIDPTLNLHTNQSKGGDAAEVIFGIGDELPAPPVGAIVEMHETGGSTNIWDWSVATQYKALVGLGPKDAGAKARYYNGWFIFRPGEQMRLPGSPSAPSNPDPQALTLGVLESNAIGLGPVTPQQDNEQQVRSTALWSDGNWRVVLTRSLAPADEGDVPFDQGIPIPMALAVWDGSQRDAAAMKMVSSWHWLIIEASPDGQ